MEDLKADLILRVERSIDVLRKDQERLTNQLAEIEPQLEEARAMLQLIKTGKSAPQTRNTSSKLTKREDALAALRLFDGEFTSLDYADVLEIQPTAAARWLKIFQDEGRTEKVSESQVTANGRTPIVWKVR